MFADKRIALLTYGSRGDVQPNVAIALALQKLGANVTLAAYDDHAEFVTQCGVRRFVGWGHTARSKFELLKDLMGDSSPGALQKFITRLSENRETDALKEYPVLQQLCITHPQDLILYHSSLELFAQAIHEKMGTPICGLIFVPWRPTRAFPAPIMDPTQLPPDGDMMQSWEKAMGNLLSPLNLKIVNTFRAQLDLAPLLVNRDVSQQGDDCCEQSNDRPLAAAFATLRDILARTPVLHAFSARVVPSAPEWKDEYITRSVGYLIMNHENGDSYTPPPEVEAFVGDGRDISQAPIYFGFGSMIHKDPPKVLDMCLQVVANTGRKAVICEGWYLLRRPSADGRVEGENPHKSLLELLSPYGIPQNRVMFVKSIPHTWLLPRCACAVVHGGAGTTAAALRAGRPCVFVPFLVDQPFWASRAIALGVSPSPVLNAAALDAQGLVAAVKTALSDTAMQERASRFPDLMTFTDGLRRVHTQAKMGEQLRGEGDGVDRVIESIVELLSTSTISTRS